MHYAAFPSPQLVNIYNLDLRDFELRDKMLRRINRVKRGIAVLCKKRSACVLNEVFDPTKIA